jgi:hypothetical protein
MGFLNDALKSSYGKDKPKFFWWYPHGTSQAEKNLLTKIDFVSPKTMPESESEVLELTPEPSSF